MESNSFRASTLAYWLGPLEARMTVTEVIVVYGLAMNQAYRLPLWPLVTAALLIVSLTAIVAPAEAQTASLPDPERSQLRLNLETFAVLPASAGRRMMELTHAGDGSGRGFVPVQEGQIWIINSDGSVPSTPLLDLTTASATASRFTRSCCAFGGLTYIAFHPDYASLGAPGFGLFYTAHEETPNGTPDYRLVEAGDIPIEQDLVNHHVIAEWRVPDPLGNGANTADGSTYREIYRLEYQDEFANPHAIGELTFNPYAVPGDADYGLLYAAVGDGTNGFSLISAPWAQDLANPFGSIIRIDPLGGDRFRVPDDNPFVSVDGAAGEIYAYGLRDPQTLSFARALNGEVELIVVDIGFDEVEEVDIVRAGENFGWDAREGTLPVQPDPAIEPTPIDQIGPLVEPVAVYDHTLPSNQTSTRALTETGPIAAIGGFNYEGSRNHELAGQYIFGDLVRGRFWHADFAAMRQARSTQTQTSVLELLVYVDGTEVVFNDLVNPGGGDRSDLRFGLGEEAEIFVLNKWDRTIRRLVATAPRTCKGKVATIVGSDAGELIRGTSGNDVIVALGGDDTVLAGAGEDTVCGGLGGDIISGGVGDDILSGDGGNDTIRGNSGNDLVIGGRNNDRLFGGSGNDKLNGAHGADRILGNAGNDRLKGGGGDDVLKGGADRDNLKGGSGNDACNGGSGIDKSSRCELNRKVEKRR